MPTSNNSKLYVSAIEIRLAGDSGKTIESIKLYKKDEQLREVNTTICAGKWHREEFVEPVSLDPGSEPIRVSAKCSSQLKKGIDVPIEVKLDDIKCIRKEGDMISYRCKERNIEVVVIAHQQPLAAITAHILHVCPRFRLLIIGNSGVGKTTLIQKLFGVDEVIPSENTRGSAEIDKEFVSTMNKRFVVHDSLGFEAGDEDNTQIVKEFVAKRKAMPEMEDHLHAVWLCLEIPYAGGRLVETGAEKFLQRRKEILGDIPLVVVLTKVDLLNDQLEIDQPENETLEIFKSRHIETNCVQPLHRAAGKDVPHVFVSSREDYADSLVDLLKATKNDMEKYHVNKAACAMAIIAQRISIKEKIELSISIGKKRYWNVLLKSATFGGNMLRDYLQVILTDVIAIWNFNVTDKRLIDDTITEALLRTDNLGDTADANTLATSESFTSLLELGLEKLFAQGDVMLIALRGVAKITISAPRKLCQLYEVAKKDARILMAYLVDLISVMQIIFLLVSGDSPMTPQTISLAMSAYEQPQKSVHLRITNDDAAMGVLPGGRDLVLEKVEDLIWLHSIPDHEIVRLRQKIPKAAAHGST